MKKSTKLIFVFFVVLSMSAVSCGRTASNETSSKSEVTITPEIESLLATLDSLLGDNNSYHQEKEAKISKLRDNYKSAIGSERKFWVASNLYDEFSAYDSDSALYYADVARRHAVELQRPDLEADMLLNRSYVLSATGLLDEALFCLKELTFDSLPNHLALNYCDRMIFLASHTQQFLGLENGLEEIYAHRADSLMKEMRAEITPDSPRYRWLLGWSSLGNGENLQEAIDIIAKSFENATLSTRHDAMDAWMLSKLYENNGDNQNRLKYLVHSAIADVRACNKEVASLEELSAILFDIGELDRASSYVNHSILNANQYKSRVRLGSLANLQEKILYAIHERSEQQAHVLRIYFIGLVIILAVLLLAVIYIWIQNSQLRRSRRTLNDANGELQQRVDELSRTREELNVTNDKLSEMYEKATEATRELTEVNESKEAYIADVFTVCSNYIDKLEGFRANLNKLLTARKFDDAIKLTKSPELSYHEVRELWATFDEIFLDLFPNFVEDFNTLLKPEERIELKKPGKLTNELRIYALVRLGMNDSQKISKFLHCSLQTVYNTRQRTRNKAIVPRDRFAKAVMNLGKKKPEEKENLNLPADDKLLTDLG